MQGHMHAGLTNSIILLSNIQLQSLNRVALRKCSSTSMISVYLQLQTTPKNRTDCQHNGCWSVVDKNIVTRSENLLLF